MKKRILLILLVLATVIFLTSCNGSKTGDDHDTLTIMGKQTDLEKSYMTSIFEQYEKATGNELDIISIEDAKYETEAAARFKRGDVPDVFMHFHNAELGYFNVDDNFYYLNNEQWTEELTDSAKAYCMDGDGNLLGLPFWESSVSGCYYNKTILDSLGMEAAATQAEFDMLCQTLKEIGYTPICWPADGCSWMMQFGLDPIFADNPNLLEQLNNNKITYADIPQVKSMVEWIAGAADKGWFGSNYMETDWSRISPSLSSGEAVMTFIWDTWFYTDFEEGKYSVEDFALMPVFMNTVDGGTYEGGNLNMMMVNKNSERLETALDFLSFCATPKNYNEAFDGIATVNCFKGQTTNIQSQMVTDSMASIEALERVSTASTRIVGYSAEDVRAAFDSLLRKRTDVKGCIELMDEYRMKEAKQ